MLLQGFDYAASVMLSSSCLSFAARSFLIARVMPRSPSEDGAGHRRVFGEHAVDLGVRDQPVEVVTPGRLHLPDNRDPLLGCYACADTFRRFECCYVALGFESCHATHRS